ncbi:hypothetical protein TUZN_1168 [Thermoproteus uzoniensis 768-20]|uniref:Uncharacterized protein n=1 Tax=Thermoproteus uzoniensis (strain 768-20) TaxID=999630 RepID=F2L0G5_THEU7|nr:hypothetical protein [Thermoproteus uzoniensis]AEA12647.1 hypothetical protein TUZN_1168 [Thermoproteus uzoniensis 768-20]
MIGLYAEKIIRTDLPLLVPICEAVKPNVIPYVDDDLACLVEALRSAYSAVALRTKNKVAVRLAAEIRPDVLILVDGLAIRGRRVKPLLRPGAAARGYYLVESREELRRIDGALAEGLFLNADSFDQTWVEEALRGRLKCDGCSTCGPVDLLVCNAYREVEVV